MTQERTLLRFETRADFRNWLVENQDTASEAWLVFSKKGSGQTTVTYDEALDVALEFGWIDGQSRSLDERSYLQRFTPRRPRSPWSMRNRRLAELMIDEGRMSPRGLAEVEKARADGRWERAYEGRQNAEPHPDFLAALEANPAAKAFYERLDGTNRFAIYYRIHQVKREETRARKIAAIVEMLSRGETFH